VDKGNTRVGQAAVAYFVAFPRNLLSKKHMASRASDRGKALHLLVARSQARSVHCKRAIRCLGEAARRTIQNHHITSGARARRLVKDPAFEHCTVKMSLFEVMTELPPFDTTYNHIRRSDPVMSMKLLLYSRCLRDQTTCGKELVRSNYYCRGDDKLM
jgi:hypothetical protein